MLPHRIRLRGPWQILSDDGTRTVRLPEDWSAVGNERTTLARQFGWPNPLTPYERVWLLLNGLTAPCTATLNERSLGSLEPPVERDITHLLRERNELLVDLPAGIRWDE